MDTDNDQLQGPSTESREAGYETSGVSVKGLAIFVVALIVTAAIVHAGMWYLMQGFVYVNELKDRQPSALTDRTFINDFNKRNKTNVSPAKLPEPPKPWIQPTYPEHNVPESDLQLMYQKEDGLFRQMGWDVDAQTHVPTAIPSNVVSAVIDQEAQARQEERSRAATRPAGQTAAPPGQGGGGESR